MIDTPSSPDSSSGMSLIRAFAQLFRLPVGILAALAGCATLYVLNPATPLQPYLLMAIVLFCMYSAACAINDYWDLDKDRINHPERPLPSGDLSLQQAWWAAVVLFGCALMAAIPLGLSPFILVAINIVLLWNYSHLLTYSGILGNVVVAIVTAALIFLGSLVANQPFTMLYPIGFLFCYILAKEIIWDVHDVVGDRTQGTLTIANQWGTHTAFVVAWGLIAALAGSIPLALLLLPMAHPLWFALFSSMMLLSLGIALARYQQQRNVSAYAGFILWERLSTLFGILGLLGTTPP